MLKRGLAVILTMAVIIGLFSSCDLISGDPAQIIARAEEQTTDHTVNISIVFTSENEDMKNAIATLECLSMSLVKSGDDFKISADLTADDLTVNKSYTVIGDVLYSEIKTNENSDSIKKRSSLTSAEKAAVVNDAGAGSVLSYEDFNEIKLETNGEVFLITCKDIKSESSDGLADAFKAYFGEDAEAVYVTDTELVVRIVDGMYNGIYLSTVYSIVIDGVAYDVRMQSVREYDYTTPVLIEAPADADLYTLTPYNDILK